jgi:hypothetical protein
MMVRRGLGNGEGVAIRSFSRFISPQILTHP